MRPLTLSPLTVDDRCRCCVNVSASQEDTEYLRALLQLFTMFCFPVTGRLNPMVATMVLHVVLDMVSEEIAAKRDGCQDVLLSLLRVVSATALNVRVPALCCRLVASCLCSPV
jgi:hypothetical protein